MSLGTVVVEASPKSGSLITARFAMENNREVFAVPGSPLDPRSKGCNQLIRQGANMVENVGDILTALPLRHQKLEETFSKPYTQNRDIAAINEAELNDARHIIIGKLGATAVSVDELIEQTHIAAPLVLTILLELELAGRLRRSSGNKVYLLDFAQLESA